MLKIKTTLHNSLFEPNQKIILSINIMTLVDITFAFFNPNHRIWAGDTDIVWALIKHAKVQALY